MPNSPHSPDIGNNSDSSISNFRITGQSLLNENCQDFRTSNDIDQQLGPVLNLTSKTRQRQKILNNDVISINCGVIVIFPIHG